MSLAAIPVQSWDVRRRRYGDGRWLMRHNEVFEIDELTDAVWRACTDRLGIGAITRVVADELALAPGHALEVTVGALQLLGDAGLVRFEPGG